MKTEGDILVYRINSLERALERAGIKPPCVLTSEHLPLLRGMAATWEAAGANPYQELVDALESHSKIGIETTHGAS